MVILGYGVAMAMLVFIGERIHTRRLGRERWLYFGHSKRPADWLQAVPWVLPPAAGLFVVGAIGLLNADPGIAGRRSPTSGVRDKLVLLMDVSPSMQIEDAGPGGYLSRRERGYTVVRNCLATVDPRIPVSVVAFYDRPQPVVVNTRDRAILDNILSDLPLDLAFTRGKAETNLIAGLEGVFELVRGWSADSTELVVVTDGDTVSDLDLPRPPSAIRRLSILGLGSRDGRLIAGRTSAQRVAELQLLARRLGGRYEDVTRKAPDGDILWSGLTRTALAGVGGHHEANIAGLQMLAGASLLSVLSVAVPLLGRRADGEDHAEKERSGWFE